MDVVEDNDAHVFVVTEGGWAKRTPLEQYRVQGRGGLGIKVARLTEERGDLVAGMITAEDDEVLVVMERGKVVRSAVSEVPAKGRDTMGVVFAKPDSGDRIIAVAKNTERDLGTENGADHAVGDETLTTPVAGRGPATLGSEEGSDEAPEAGADDAADLEDSGSDEV